MKTVRALRMWGSPEIEAHLAVTGVGVPGEVKMARDLEIDDLTAIFEGQHLPRLTHLGLANSTLADPICERLPPAPILPQLRTLDLSLGTLSDDGARVLAAHARAFAHLELLDLSRSYLSKKGQQLVEGICQQVLLEDQQEDEQDPRNRYIAAGE